VGSVAQNALGVTDVIDLHGGLTVHEHFPKKDERIGFQISPVPRFFHFCRVVDVMDAASVPSSIR
jgi:hypothetical protein